MAVKLVQIVGAGHPTSNKLLDLTKEILRELNLQAEVEYITDVKKIVEMGLMETPALLLDGAVIISGRVPKPDKLKQIFQETW